MTADVNVTEKVREALRQNLRDTTGDCVCDPAYTERGLIDPHCGWHEAEGTTDDESVARVLAALADPNVLAGIAGALYRLDNPGFPWEQAREDYFGLAEVYMRRAAEVVEWLRGAGAVSDDCKPYRKEDE